MLSPDPASHHHPDTKQEPRRAPPKITCRQAFYITLPILHGLSAIAALVICFQCNVGQMSLQARVPRAPRSADVGLPFNSSQVRLFLSAYRWAEDAEFATHTWNPFALTMVFQWLTAGFALRNVAPLAPEGVLATVWYAWLFAGYTVFFVWSLVQTNAFCVAMFATVTVCFLASALVCFAALGPPRLCSSQKGEPGQNNHSNATRHPQGDSRLLLAKINGRLWWVHSLLLLLLLQIWTDTRARVQGGPPNSQGPQAHPVLTGEDTRDSRDNSRPRGGDGAGLGGVFPLCGVLHHSPPAVPGRGLPSRRRRPRVVSPQ
jgi:hypothetical protein